MVFELCHDYISYLVSIGCEDSRVEKGRIRTEIFCYCFMLAVEIHST